MSSNRALGRRMGTAAIVAGLLLACGARAVAAPTHPPLILQGENLQAALARISLLAARQGEANDGTPAITEGRIATPVVTIGKAPALPRVDVRYTAPSGLQDLQIAFFSPSDKEFLQLDYTAAAPTTVRRGSLSLQTSSFGTLGLYAEHGTWTVAFAAIIGFNGQTVYYTSDQLAAIFPTTSFKLINANPSDIAPPQVTAGVLLTPVVNLAGKSPYAAVQLSTTDDVSGTASATIDIISPDQQYWLLSGTAPRPAKTGSILTGLNLARLPTPKAGTWTIAGYSVTDAAGNVYSDFNAADIQALLGTTTFRVTH